MAETYKDALYVKTDTDEFYLKGRSCELSAFSFVPTERHEPKERTCFNSEKKVRKVCRTSLLTLDTIWRSVTVARQRGRPILQMVSD